MVVSRVVELSLVSLCFLLATAFVLRRLPLGPPASWTPSSSTCPPAWRSGANENVNRQDTYRQCLARHGRELDGGFSLQCAADCAAFPGSCMLEIFAWGTANRIWTRNF